MSALTDLRRIDLNLLVAFEALMSERSVTRAAERLGIGQSAMSSTLGRLRKLLGDPVLVRDGRRLVATPFAESLIEPVRRLLNDAEHLLARRETFNPATDSRTLTVLIVDYHLTLTFLQPVLARLEQEAPGVRLHIEMPGEDFIGRLSRHEVDLLIIPQEAFPDYRQFPHRALFRDRYVVAADAHHPDIGGRISYDQFCTLPYLATWSGRTLSLIERQLDVMGVPRNLEITTDSGVAPFLLRDTRMITVVQERFALAIAKQANLQLSEVPVKNINFSTETMIWSQRTDSDPAHQWLRQLLADMSSEFAPGI
ncbi:LysR family transcriptional regulator [Rhodococcus sp. USK13]|uniref:LysR family transcriptional regulator n=1 Tax=Rhodococcus sp. USK13 TaxID=2806442 RepID=UPI001BD05892|nr:LysR family transcriptional regulator [Rhodococcus sp. USK13]